MGLQFIYLFIYLFIYFKRVSHLAKMAVYHAALIKYNISQHIYIYKCNKYSRLSLSRIPRASLKHFEISVPRHIRVERVRKTMN